MATDPLAEELQIYIDEIEAKRDPDDNEIEAYARMKNRVQGDKDAILAKYERESSRLHANCTAMLKEQDNRDKAIEWKYGQMIAQMVAAKIQGRRQRSIKTLFGVVGYRKSPAKTTRNIRCDNATLIAWASKYCAGALVEKKTYSVDKGELPETCEHMWIEETPETDTFYWKPAKVQEKNDGE